MRPRARRDGVISERLGRSGLQVHDRRNGTVHRLGPVKALVWQLADGERNLTDIRDQVREELQIQADLELVLETLGRLRGLGLIDDGETVPAGAQRISREEWLRRVTEDGLATAWTAPAVSPRTKRDRKAESA